MTLKYINKLLILYILASAFALDAILVLPIVVPIHMGKIICPFIFSKIIFKNVLLGCQAFLAVSRFLTDEEKAGLSGWTIRTDYLDGLSEWTI